MNRRQFLTRAMAGAALVALPHGGSRAIGPMQTLRVQRIRYRGNWSVHSGAGRVLSEEARLRTSMAVGTEEVPVDLTSDALYDSAFAVLAGDEPFAFTDSERQALKRWLGLGGFLLVDNAGRTAVAQGFDRSIRRELELMYPRERLARVSPEHVLFRSFYRLDYPAGRVIRKAFVEGLMLGKRYAVVLQPNDLLGALAQDSVGNFSFVPSPGGDKQREMAMRFGVNLLMYATCLHYKDDQVHIDHLLRTRKWKISPPK